MNARALSVLPHLPVLMVLIVLAGCGGVTIAPTPSLPKALVTKIEAKVGVVIPADQRNFVHSETRGGVPWTITLGPGHQQYARAVHAAGFREVLEFPDLDAARAAAGLAAILEPRIEQYSFATARETGGEYVAVTIRYRIKLYAPDGGLVDSFTLTGYGSAEAKGMSGGEPLSVATRGAMRDAAAKFLTQFPAQAVAKQMARGEALVAAVLPAAGVALAGGGDLIETVPVRAPRRRAAPPPIASR
jgi:hypothetical protein